MEQMKQVFLQLSKLDPFQGVATGIIASAVPDRDGEVMDYFASKPYFEQWSKSQMAASAGKSKGNVRLQHNPQSAVGRVMDLRFDDTKQEISAVVKLDDENAKNLLQAGVLTGFSIGGAYVKKTPHAGGLTSYVAAPSEVSVVDRPCNPAATFALVQADGSASLCKFAKTMGQDDLAEQYCSMIKAMPEQQAQMILGVTPGQAYIFKKTNIHQVLNKANTIARRRERLEEAFGIRWFGGR